MISIKKSSERPASLVAGISSEEYHGDKSAIGSTTLKTILKSPEHFVTAFTEPKSDTAAMAFGRMFHAALLEPETFSKRYIVEPDCGDLRTKAGKEAKAQWIKEVLSFNPGSESISIEESTKIEEMVKKVYAHSDAFMLEGKKEVTGFYNDPITGIFCKIRPDCYNAKHKLLIDVKTTQDCGIDEFSKEIANRLYHFQMAMYCEGLHAITGIPIEHAMYIVVEKSAPYAVAFYELDKLTLDIGKELYRAALDTLSTCLETNTWGSYQQAYQSISLPTWAIKKGIL